MRENNLPYSSQHVLDAYKTLYVQFYPKLYNYGRKFTTDNTLIEDSIQDIFLDYWKRNDEDSRPAAVNSYFFAAFRYALFKKINRERRIRPLNTPDQDPVFDPSQLISRHDTSAELQQQLQAAMQQLTGRQREALFLRFYEGLSYEEIAGIMGITVKASYKLMARSLLQLKQHLSWVHWWLLLSMLSSTK